MRTKTGTVHLIALNVALAPFEIEIWDQDALSRMLRDRPQIITEFFGPAVAKRFCGEHTVIAVEIAGADAVATADAVMRGPPITVGGYEKRQRAGEIADSDPAEALALYREVRDSLIAAGFPAHAAEFDEPISRLLVATEAENEAIALVMEKLWVAERVDDSLSARVTARTLKSLSGFPDLGPGEPVEGASPVLVASARVVEFVADNLHQPLATQLNCLTLSCSNSMRVTAHRPGPDINARGLDVEGHAYFYIDQLQAILREWVATVYHHERHDSLTVGQVMPVQNDIHDGNSDEEQAAAPSRFDGTDLSRYVGDGGTLSRGFRPGIVIGPISAHVGSPLVNLTDQPRLAKGHHYGQDTGVACGSDLAGERSGTAASPGVQIGSVSHERVAVDASRSVRRGPARLAAVPGALPAASSRQTSAQSSTTRRTAARHIDRHRGSSSRSSRRWFSRVWMDQHGELQGSCAGSRRIR